MRQRKKSTSMRFAKFACVIFAIMMVVSMVFTGPAMAQTVTKDISFLGVGNPSFVETTIAKGCLNQTMVSATVTIGPVNMRTKGTGTNISNVITGVYLIHDLDHRQLALQLMGAPGAAGTPLSPALMFHAGQSVGDATHGCNPAAEQPYANAHPPCLAGPPGAVGQGDHNAGSWNYFLNPLQTITLPPYLLSHANAAAPVVFNTPGPNLEFFHATAPGDTMTMRLTTEASINPETPGTWQQDIRTDANGTIAITYVCQSPTLACNYKHLDGTSTLNYPSGTTFPKEVTVEVRFTNGLEPQVIQVRDTLPNANWTYKSGSTVQTSPATIYISGNPTGTGTAGNPLLWTSNPAVPAGTSVTFHFTAIINSMTPGSCDPNNSIAVHGVSGGDSTCTAQACLAQTPGRVPTMNQWGVIILSLVLAGGALWLLRRKRSA